MSVADRFRTFFAAANGGADAYPWQVALAERVARTGAWPAAITAPTGSGKSSVVDVHVFLVAERERQRLAGTPTIVRPPRRLVLVAPRRVLVDDQHARALQLAKLLQSADDGSPLAEVRAALASMVTSTELHDDPLGVARLRGGVRLDLSWRLDPARCQIVCATPQMWGSRLLMRGFRSSQRARNLESGLLAHDATVVIDEAHLHGRLVDTAQRVAAMGSAPGRLQVVAMSATQATPGGHTLGAADHEDDALAQRVHAKKSVEVELVDDWVNQRAPRIAAAAQRLRNQDADVGTVGVFVNTVALALYVAERLKSDGDATIRIVCGRMRPADLDRLRDEFPGLLDARGNHDVDFLVSTQSLEVGVDLDLGAMVSELAPASAIVQRAGRLNRSGSRALSRLVIVAPEELAGGDPEEFKPSMKPYEPGQLRQALEWLEQLGSEASPQRISELPLPPNELPRVPDITTVEIETLAMTSLTLAADPDVGFYVEDPVDSEEARVLVGARDHLDLDEAVVGAALRAAPPRAHELAGMSAGKVLDAIRSTCTPTWTIRMENGERSAFPTETAERVQAGDVLLVPSGSRVVVERVLGAPSPRSEPIDDVVFARPRDDGLEPDEILRLEGLRAEQVSALVEEDPVLGTRRSRRELADIVKASRPDLAQRLRKHGRLSDLTITWCGDETRPDAPGLLAVVASDREGRASEAIAAAGEVVTVDEHCAAVATRAREIVAALDQLAAGEAADIEDAARMHDEGKRHPSFQQRMGARPQDPVLAKPRPGHKPDRGDGWRHEQYSAGVAHARLGRPLTTALTAAHHGNGLPTFNRDDEGVLAGWEDAPAEIAHALTELFGAHGRYETDRTALQRKLGIHRLAFLEALVRCADMQISREVPD